MTISAQAFVPTDEIRKLTRGSYEQLIVRITEAAESELAVIFGESSWEIVSTFANHALVLGENNKCVRVQFEDKQGVVQILGTSEYPIKTVTEPAYIKAEAKKVVDAFIAGGTTEAKERITDLVRRVPAKRGISEERIVAAVRDRVSAERPWKRHFADKSANFKNFLGESVVADLKAKQPAVKFRSLVEGEIQTADMDTYYTVVQEALADLGSKLESLQHELEDASLTLKALAPAIAALDESEVLTALDTFAQDLLSDIRSIYKVTQESVHQVGGVTQLGQIYDSIAENFNQYEVAVRFVVEMTKSLSEANQ